MSASEYNPATGVRTTKTYSKFYDAGEWAVRNKVGVSLVVEHDKKEIPFVYGFQQSLGALGPDDLHAKGSATLFLWNRTDQPQTITIKNVIIEGQSLLKNGGKRVDMPKNSITDGKVGSADISNYATELSARVACEIDGKPLNVQLKLHRRTFDELKAYFGPNGKPPYPWIK